MYAFILTVHIIVVIVLTGMILVQRGRSSGLVEALGGVESIFGTKTSAVFVKITVFLAIIFFITSITLAYLSKNRSASLLNKVSAENTGPISKAGEKKKASSNKILPQTSKKDEGARK